VHHKGQAAIICSEGVLFGGNGEENIRKNILLIIKGYYSSGYFHGFFHHFINNRFIGIIEILSKTNIPFATPSMIIMTI
jgi:type I restriction-modification system DNA methylase subunit